MTAVAPVGEMVLGLPEVSLRPFVDRYVGYREHADLPLVRRESAGVFVVLILGWGAPLDVTDLRSAERGAGSAARQARAAGAEITREPFDTDYGSRDYAARDLAGTVWAFGTYRP
ncbi:hypothetical protein [Micromonospora sp. NPDC048898]|uniref:hypothetical protein n=1 Tax=Micromonospora sp. NPDC048898 TaxID=3364260 RepID=UPI00371FB034